MSEKRFFFHQFSASSLSGIQFRNPFNSRIIVWEIEKSEESSRVFGLSLSVSVWSASTFSAFSFPPSKRYLAIISSSKIFVYFHILCIFANLVAHLKDPKWDSSILWDDIDGCKYFLKQSILVVCMYTRTQFSMKRDFCSPSPSFRGKKAAYLCYSDLWFRSFSIVRREKSGSCGCLRRMKVEWISCLFKSWSWAAAHSVTHNRLIFTNLSLTLSSSLPLTIHLTSMIR